MRTWRCSPPTPSSLRSPISFSASGTPREGAFNVNGMRSTYNNFLLDGLDNNCLRDQQPGLLRPVGAVVAGRARRIQSHHQQLQRRIRARGRRGGERRHEVRHQRDSRLGLRVPAQHGAERHRLPVQSRRLREAHRCSATSSGHHRRTDRQEQAFLLRATTKASANCSTISISTPSPA